MRQVARRQVQVLVDVLGDDQRAAAVVLQLGGQRLRVRLVDRERLDDLEAALAIELGQDRLDRAAIHFLVDLLREAARTRRERAATADEDRGTIIAVTRTAALLLLELLGRAGQVRTRLLRLGA